LLYFQLLIGTLILISCWVFYLLLGNGEIVAACVELIKLGHVSVQTNEKKKNENMMAATTLSSRVKHFFLYTFFHRMDDLADSTQQYGKNVLSFFIIILYL
jgi:hypothetical protein